MEIHPKLGLLIIFFGWWRGGDDLSASSCLLPLLCQKSPSSDARVGFLPVLWTCYIRYDVRRWETRPFHTLEILIDESGRFPNLCVGGWEKQRRWEWEASLLGLLYWYLYFLTFVSRTKCLLALICLSTLDSSKTGDEMTLQWMDDCRDAGEPAITFSKSHSLPRWHNGASRELRRWAIYFIFLIRMEAGWLVCVRHNGDKQQ